MGGKLEQMSAIPPEFEQYRGRILEDDSVIINEHVFPAVFVAALWLTERGMSMRDVKRYLDFLKEERAREKG